MAHPTDYSGLFLFDFEHVSACDSLSWEKDLLVELDNNRLISADSHEDIFSDIIDLSQLIWHCTDYKRSTGYKYEGGMVRWINYYRHFVLRN